VVPPTSRRCRLLDQTETFLVGGCALSSFFGVAFVYGVACPDLLCEQSQRYSVGSNGQRGVDQKPVDVGPVGVPEFVGIVESGVVGLGSVLDDENA
jgi:hypothetical protein